MRDHARSCVCRDQRGHGRRRVRWSESRVGVHGAQRHVHTAARGLPQEPPEQRERPRRAPELRARGRGSERPPAPCHGTTMPAAATSNHETNSPSGLRRGSRSAVHTSDVNRMSSRVEPVATSGRIESRPPPSTEMGDTACLDTYVSNASGASDGGQVRADVAHEGQEHEGGERTVVPFGVAQFELRQGQQGPAVQQRGDRQQGPGHGVH